MPSTPYTGLNDAFEFASVASPSTFTTLNGVDSVAISGDKVTMAKTTTMASTNGVDTFIAATQDPGSVDVKGLFYPGDTTQIALEAIRLAAVAVPMKITYGSSNSCSFSGIVESFTPSFPLEKAATFDLKIKITGVKTYV
jgi:hypothetical protein